MIGTGTTQHPSSQLKPFALSGVSLIVAGSLLILVFAAGRYDFHGEELYYKAAGRRLSFGYADQGPALPFVAHIMDLLAPDSLLVLRLPGILLTVLAIVLCAAIAREFGGGTSAQLLAATAYATSPYLLLQAKVLGTNTIDAPLWVLVTWLLVRWVRTRREVLLAAAAVVTAVDLQVKWLIPFFWIAIALGALACGPRDLLRNRTLALGAAGALLSLVPGLVWQARHGWPQLRMGAAISDENSSAGFLAARLTFVPTALLYAGVLGAILLLYGLWWLLRACEYSQYRFLAYGLVLLAVFFTVVGGTPYYVQGMYGVVIAAGAVGITERARAGTKGAGIPVIALSVVVLLWFTPWRAVAEIEPAVSSTSAGCNIAADGVPGLPRRALNCDPSLYGQFGWPELTSAVTEAYRRLSAEVREKAVIVTETYWQASALDQFGREFSLPAIYSPMRGFGYFGGPPDSATTVLYVGTGMLELRTQCAVLQPVGRFSSRLGRPDSTRDIDIWKCSEPRRPWSQLWPGYMSLDA